MGTKLQKQIKRMNRMLGITELKTHEVEQCYTMVRAYFPAARANFFKLAEEGRFEVELENGAVERTIEIYRQLGKMHYVIWERKRSAILGVSRWIGRWNLYKRFESVDNADKFMSALKKQSNDIAAGK